MTTRRVTGFSKKTKEEKIDWLISNFIPDNSQAKNLLQTYWNTDQELQALHDDFIENTLSNFYLPFGIAPNFLIDGSWYAIPMVIEESSVVAAASNAAKFWADRGGFRTEVISMIKNGQVHFNYFGNFNALQQFVEEIKPKLIDSISELQKNMKARGGGLVSLELINCTEKLGGYYQLDARFETLDAMGANFINSCLEAIAQTFENEATNYNHFIKEQSFPEVVMSILSNYVPECLVKAEVSCDIDALSNKEVSGRQFATDFVRAVNIAQVEPKRAVTHNKGIMNGIDAVVLATGNDFRAVEAGIHAYAAKDGHYKSLTQASITGNRFHFQIEIPLALGTVGGLTSLHPLVKLAFEILQKPNAESLMRIVAVAGLAQNFAALRSLVTTGIQAGHMKMHLMNILNQMQASKANKTKAVAYFKDKSVTHQAVADFLTGQNN